jgi:hypothetical protein
MVPCNPVSVFESEYGKDKWQVPLKSGYTWLNFVMAKTWSDEQWPQAIEFYTQKGLDTERTSEYILRYQKPNVYTAQQHRRTILIVFMCCFLVFSSILLVLLNRKRLFKNSRIK